MSGFVVGKKRIKKFDELWLVPKWDVILKYVFMVEFPII